MKNLGLYDNNLSIPRKQDVTALETRVKTTEDTVSAHGSSITSLQQDVKLKLTIPNGNQGQVLGFIQNNVVGAIDAPQGGGGVYTDTFEGTIATNGWTANGSSGFYQQISVPGMTSTQCPLVFPKWTSNKANEVTAWNSLEGIESFDGYVRFYSKVQTSALVNFSLIYSNAFV